MEDLTLNEEIVLLTVWKLGENAYGVTLRKEISDSTGRLFPYGTLYSVLGKLTGRGFLVKSAGTPVAERGGRRKYYYSITDNGIKALRTAMELKHALWGTITEIPLGNG